jgi:hypothetical protein
VPTADAIVLRGRFALVARFWDCLGLQTIDCVHYKATRQCSRNGGGPNRVTGERYWNATANAEVGGDICLQSAYTHAFLIHALHVTPVSHVLRFLEEEPEHDTATEQSDDDHCAEVAEVGSIAIARFC